MTLPTTEQEARAKAAIQHKAILGIFWHRTRKAYLPRTLGEIAQARSMKPTQAGMALADLRRAGLVECRPSKGDKQYDWWITESGAKIAEAMAVQA